MRWDWISILAFALLVCWGAASSSSEDVLFQASTLDALKEGVFDGNTTIMDLKEHGDFGLGTFDRPDGEMVVLDGVVYQAKADGSIHVANDSVKTPFADVTSFQPDIVLSLEGSYNLTELEKRLEGHLPAKKSFLRYKDRWDLRPNDDQERPRPEHALSIFGRGAE